MERPQNQILTIFGASGDLAKRKLLPALFELFMRRLLPEKFRILCVARTPMTTRQFRESRAAELSAAMGEFHDKQRHIDEFFEMVDYFSFETADTEKYTSLKNEIDRIRKQYSTGERTLFYLGMPPSMYTVTADGLKACGLADENSRIVIEKPFGSDLESARLLNKKLNSIFSESQIFRIDHYLGKETVQNILVLRFSNGIFEPVWNRNYIDSVEISATETVGVEKRGAYYDSAGALRDMVQNHLLELMTFVAMECPPNFKSDAVRDEVSKVLASLRRMDERAISKNVFRGQYAEGEIDGKKVAAYRDEPNVDKNSTTETYVAMRLFIDNWRWGGVPFYIYTGKRLGQKRSEITINFKSTPYTLFAGQCEGRSCNSLTLRIQPDEAISLRFGLKVPGKGFQATQVAMNFNYSSLADITLPDAYSRLLLDAMAGDSTLFARSDAVEAGWKFVDPIEKYWEKHGGEIPLYPAGSDGTEEAMEMKLEHLNSVCSLPIVNELSSNIEEKA